MVEVLPTDSSYEDLEVEESLPFLQRYVDKKIQFFLK